MDVEYDGIDFADAAKKLVPSMPGTDIRRGFEVVITASIMAMGLGGWTDGSLARQFAVASSAYSAGVAGPRGPNAGPATPDQLGTAGKKNDNNRAPKQPGDGSQAAPAGQPGTGGASGGSRGSGDTKGGKDSGSTSGDTPYRGRPCFSYPNRPCL